MQLLRANTTSFTSVRGAASIPAIRISGYNMRGKMSLT